MRSCSGLVSLALYLPSKRNTLVVVHVELSLERRVLGLVEVLGHNFGNKTVDIVHNESPGASGQSGEISHFVKCSGQQW